MNFQGERRCDRAAYEENYSRKGEEGLGGLGSGKGGPASQEDKDYWKLCT